MKKINWNVVVRNVIIVILVFIVTRLNYTIKDLKLKNDLLSGQIKVLKSELTEQVNERLNERVEKIMQDSAEPLQNSGETAMNSAKMKITAYCACKKCCRTERLWDYSLGN